MLIQALCNYYDILSAEGKVLPEGYSKVKIHYLISLTEEGTIDNIINVQREIAESKKEKVVKRLVPKEVEMPKRTEKSGIEANISEHRPLYIFGLNRDKKTGELFTKDRTEKAKKSHKAFVEKNLEFIEDLKSPIIDAYRQFLLNWNPEDELENKFLLGLGKDYETSGFSFTLSGKSDTTLLYEDIELKKKWDAVCKTDREIENEKTFAQCAITGEEEPIARIHRKIKGVYGGLATGSVLIGFKNNSGCSYGNEQSYNSNISEKVMKKYTEALNVLLSSSKHKILLDGMTIVFWAMDKGEKYEDLFLKMLSKTTDKIKAKELSDILQKLMRDGQKGKVVKVHFLELDKIDEDVDFYILGLKPNSSRLSVKFIFRKKYADILWNISKFQQELKIVGGLDIVSIHRIYFELTSPEYRMKDDKNNKINPALLAKIFESIIYGTPYPNALLETVVRRVRVDSGSEKLNGVRAGMIKAYINRNYKKEELKMALDKENKGQAYLSGRLFAVLEKLQQEAHQNGLNRTIKDSYFSSASMNPQMVFPKLLRLGQAHLKKVSYPVFYNKLIGEIIDSLNGGFPKLLSLKEQGEFIVGYYQQYQSFFEKNEKNASKEEEEK